MNLNNRPKSNSVTSAGRPSKFTEETVNILVEAVVAGLTNRAACSAAGISEQSLSDWRENKPGFSERLEGAREASRSRALLAIKEAGLRDWRANHAWLLLTSPDHKPVKQNVVASVHVDNSIRSQICTPEKLERIRELRRNAMANQNLTRSDD